MHLLALVALPPDPSSAWRQQQHQQQQELEWSRGERQLEQQLRAFRGSPRLEEGLWGSPLLDFGLVQSALQPSLPIRPDRAHEKQLDAERARIHAEDYEQLAEIRRPPDDHHTRERHAPEPEALPFDVNQLL